MIDLHTHTLFSDGVLLPSELVYRAKIKGYRAIALTDHVDYSNIDLVIPRINKVASTLSPKYRISVLPGAEITYVPPELIKKTVTLARKLGAKIVVIHGETPAETVPKGTNLAGITSGADILAHPGYITEKEAHLAKKNGVCLEITTRKGHNAANRHVASIARKTGAKLVLNTDSHAPENLLDAAKIRETLRRAGLKHSDYEKMRANSYNIIKRRKD
ncbi:MAG: histidinol phosphate phosphatase domain-containing protein [Endomicrobiales bacterium]|nr:histidinol phosphate phosphatase domain-containing protein [Endomicrobiales bacterium]